MRRDGGQSLLRDAVNSRYIHTGSDGEGGRKKGEREREREAEEDREKKERRSVRFLMKPSLNFFGLFSYVRQQIVFIV